MLPRLSFLIGILLCTSAIAEESGFSPLFNGRDLTGWTLHDKHGEGYGVKDGVLYCAKGSGGKLLTDKQYGDFILRFEFKLEPGSNNGVGIRTPAEGDPAYVGMEIQVLDDGHPKYASLRPGQYHGSIYDVVPAKRGALKPTGEWNKQEIIAEGRKIRVVLNGTTIVDTDLSAVTDPAVLKKHPGLARTSGHIGFLGHNDYVEFRNISIRELPAAPAAR